MASERLIHRWSGQRRRSNVTAAFPLTAFAIKNIARKHMCGVSVSRHVSEVDGKYRSMRVLVVSRPVIATHTNGQSLYDVLDKSQAKSNSTHDEKQE
jgi:hypothetical protein